LKELRDLSNFSFHLKKIPRRNQEKPLKLNAWFRKQQQCRKRTMVAISKRDAQRMHSFEG
jgi:hypothetical protein